LRASAPSIYDDSIEPIRQANAWRRRSVEHILFQLAIVLASLSVVSAILAVLGKNAAMSSWLWISPAILLVACMNTAFRTIRMAAQMVASPLFWVLFALIYSFGKNSTIELMDRIFAVGASELFLTNMLNSIGMLAVVIGLTVGRKLVGRQPETWVQRFERMDGLHVAGVLAVVGLVAEFFLGLPFVFGLIGTQSMTLMQMQMLSKAALIILSYFSAVKGGKTTVWFIVLFMIEIVIAGLVNSKMVIFEVIIAALVGRTLAVRKTITFVKGIAVLGLLQIILQPVMSEYRRISHNLTDSITGNYATSVQVTGELMTQSFSDLVHGKNAAQTIAPQAWWSRLCYVPQEAFVMQEYDGGRPGSPWGDFLLALVPRIIWRDKPLIRPGVNFSILFEGNPNTNNAPGILSEGYWYGGWLGLVVVSLFTGVLLGGIDRISSAIMLHHAWVFMPLVFIGIRSGFRIDGFFSTEIMFGSLWYVLFAIGISCLSAFFLRMPGALTKHEKWRA